MERDWLYAESEKPRIVPGSLVEFAASERKSESLVSGMVTKVYDVNGRTYADVLAVIGEMGKVPHVPYNSLRPCSKKTREFVFEVLRGELTSDIKHMSPFSVEKRLLKKAEEDLFQK